MLQFRTPNYNGIKHLSFLTDGRLFVHGYNKIGLWNFADDQRQEMDDRAFETVVVCPDGRGVIMDDSSGGVSWFPFDKTVQKKSIAPNSYLYIGQFTTDEQYFVALTGTLSTGLAWLWWQVNTWKLVKATLKLPTELPVPDDSQTFRILSLKFSPNGEWVVFYSYYSPPVAVHTPTQTQYQTKLTSTSNLKVVFNPDSRSFVAWSVSRLNVVNLETQEVKTFSVKSDRTITAAAFTADGRHLLTVGNDKTVRVLETTTFREVHSYAWPIGKLQTIAISHDGLTAAIAGRNSKVIIWDLDL
jgi:WD40 repeat protein